MKQVTILADPSDPYLKSLEDLNHRAEASVVDSAEKFSSVIARTEILLCWDHAFNFLLPTFWSKAASLRWIQTIGVGVEPLLFGDLVESPVTLTNAKGVYSQSLAEFTIGAAVFFAKDFRRMLRSQAAHQWDQFEVAELSGQTLGVIGYGDIGQKVGSLARCLGMRVLACRKHLTDQTGSEMVQALYGADRLPEMLHECDYAVVCVPLTPETSGMLGERELRAMKSTAVLINISRGAVVDEAALIRALQEK